MWTGFVCPVTVSREHSNELFVFLEMHVISWLDKRIWASQKWPYTMESDNLYEIWTFRGVIIKNILCNVT